MTEQQTARFRAVLGQGAGLECSADIMTSLHWIGTIETESDRILHNAAEQFFRFFGDEKEQSLYRKAIHDTIMRRQNG